MFFKGNNSVRSLIVENFVMTPDEAAQAAALQNAGQSIRYIANLLIIPRTTVSDAIPLSAKTVKDRTIKISANITNQQIEDLKLAFTISRAVDESSVINDTLQVSLFVRFISTTGTKEKLLRLLLLRGKKAWS